MSRSHRSSVRILALGPSRVGRLLTLLLITVVVLIVACGDDDEAPDPSPTVIVPTATVGPTATAERRPPCSLLAVTDVVDALGVEPGLVVPHDGPGTLRFCTVYLEVPECDGQCALSLDDLGPVSENANNTPALFRQAIETANPDATFTFEDGLLGENSWLATISTAELEWRLLYFQVNGVAYDFGSPKIPAYQPTSEQMIALGQAAIDNLQ